MYKSRIVLSLALMVCATAVFANPVTPVIKGQSAILIDAVSGQIIYEKACRKKMSPASTTKMMTAILALEHCKLTDTCTASDFACKTPFGNLHLKPGETLDLDNLLTGTLLRSANDGAVCVAEKVAGSQAKFVEMMNAKAKELGAKDTHFVNPHGLYDPKHYSTAYDLAQIARYGVKIPEFNQIVRTKTARLERSINTKDLFVKNTARFLWRYPGADGIKTGYTKQAGRCFVGSATRNGWRLIAVVLKSPDAGDDTMALLNYGFKFYQPATYACTTKSARSVPVAGGVDESLDLMPSKDLGLVIRKPAPAAARTEIVVLRAIAPITRGQKLGTLTGYLNDKKIGAVDLIAAKSVERTLTATLMIWVKNITLAVAIAFLGFITYGTQAAKTARRRRRGVTPGR